MPRFSAIALCAILTACSRQAPAPLVSCRADQQFVAIEGAPVPQPALATHCRDDRGLVTLRP